MVSIEKKKSPSSATLPVILMSLTLFALLLWIFDEDSHPVTAASYQSASSSSLSSAALRQVNLDIVADVPLSERSIQKAAPQCPYTHITDLTPDERHPHQGPRHMITPPQGGLVHLLCCETTQGSLNALVHEKWAPLGAARVLEMVHTGYFNAGVPLMRCIKGFLCQFGLNNNPLLSQVYKSTIKDDPQWLPPGPKHRTNADGVARFARGYLAYAGGGANTRDNQLIVSLDNVPSLAGKSPWEVPWGELVGEHSFETLSRFYTGYGEEGPSQGDMWKTGVTDKVKKKFPELDYITACQVVDQEIQVVS